MWRRRESGGFWAMQAPVNEMEILLFCLGLYPLTFSKAMTHYVSKERLERLKESNVRIQISKKKIDLFPPIHTYLLIISVTGTFENFVKPSNSYYLARVLDAKLVVFEGCGHAVIAEVPDRFNKAIGDWVNDCGSGGDAKL